MKEFRDLFENIIMGILFIPLSILFFVFGFIIMTIYMVLVFIIGLSMFIKYFTSYIKENKKVKGFWEYLNKKLSNNKINNDKENT